MRQCNRSTSATIAAFAAPVFGIIKAALGFRQFSLRGLDKVRGEWSLVTMAWNMKRMFALSPA
jgi:Transposase DDE domain